MCFPMISLGSRGFIDWDRRTKPIPYHCVTRHRRRSIVPPLRDILIGTATASDRAIGSSFGPLGRPVCFVLTARARPCMPVASLPRLETKGTSVNERDSRHGNYASQRKAV
jgi:hypothetical protein